MPNKYKIRKSASLQSFRQLQQLHQNSNPVAQLERSKNSLAFTYLFSFSVASTYRVITVNATPFLRHFGHFSKYKIRKSASLQSFRQLQQLHQNSNPVAQLERSKNSLAFTYLFSFSVASTYRVITVNATPFLRHFGHFSISKIIKIVADTQQV